MTTPKPLDHVAALKAYVPGGKLNAYAGDVALLGSNETPLGASPRALAAMRDVLSGAHIYPDPDYLALRTAIAEAQGIADVSRIVTSAGSGELIHLLTQAYAGAGDEVLFTEHAFSLYEVAASSHGATAVRAPESELTAGLNALLGAVTARTRILFLATPNNPTGTAPALADLERLQDALPPQVLLVLDGAYAEYLGTDYEAALRDLATRRENTVMLRTFSKIHGLAAVRLGWAYMPAHVATILQRLRGPFNVSSVAAAAGAVSIRDREHIEAARLHNLREGYRLRAGLNALGLPTPVSLANFLIPDIGSEARAAACFTFLAERGILVRRIAGYGLPTRLRITIGSVRDTTRILEALSEFTAEH